MITPSLFLQRLKLNRIAPLAIIFLALQSASIAVPKTDAEREAAIAKARSTLETKLGGAEKLKAAFLAARAEQGRLDGILEVSGPIEERFRANGAVERADQVRKGADALAPFQPTLRDKFARVEALGIGFDPAEGRAAYEHTYALFAATKDKPVIDKWKVFVAHGKIDVEALKAGQLIADILLAASR